jgi:hypothetical protein
MKNFLEFHGQMNRIVYYPLTRSFGTKQIRHPFETQCDPLTKHLLADVGLDTEAAAYGELKRAA